MIEIFNFKTFSYFYLIIIIILKTITLMRSRVYKKLLNYCIGKYSEHHPFPMEI